MDVEKQIKTRFTGQKAVQYILEPGSDSELSELDDDDDDYTDETAIESAGPSNTVEEDDSQNIEGGIEATVNESPPKEDVFK